MLIFLAFIVSYIFSRDDLKIIWKVLRWRSRYPCRWLDSRKRGTLDDLVLWSSSQVDGLTNGGFWRRTLVRRILMLLMGITLVLLLLLVHMLIGPRPRVTSGPICLTLAGIGAKGRTQSVAVVDGHSLSQRPGSCSSCIGTTVNC